MEREVYPKEFIHDYLILQFRSIIQQHAYLGFCLISLGIEFLGKCLDNNAKSWNEEGKSSEHFKRAIIKLFPEKYHPFVQELYLQLRCGMAHALRLGKNISLTEEKSLKSKQITRETHLKPNQESKVTLVIEYFYSDFVEACKKIIETEFPFDDKMNKPFFKVCDEL